MTDFGQILSDLNTRSLVALQRIASRERDLADLSELEAAHGELPDSRHDRR